MMSSLLLSTFISCTLGVIDEQLDLRGKWVGEWRIHKSYNALYTDEVIVVVEEQTIDTTDSDEFLYALRIDGMRFGVNRQGELLMPTLGARYQGGYVVGHISRKLLTLEYNASSSSGGSSPAPTVYLIGKKL